VSQAKDAILTLTHAITSYRVLRKAYFKMQFASVRELKEEISEAVISVSEATLAAVV
jgi:hypothetical protein